MNLLDFSSNRAKDLFLLDIYSDRSQHGGISDTSLEIINEADESYLEMKCHF